MGNLYRTDLPLLLAPYQGKLEQAMSRMQEDLY